MSEHVRTCQEHVVAAAGLTTSMPGERGERGRAQQVGHHQSMASAIARVQQAYRQEHALRGARAVHSMHDMFQLRVKANRDGTAFQASSTVTGRFACRDKGCGRLAEPAAARGTLCAASISVLRTRAPPGEAGSAHPITPSHQPAAVGAGPGQRLCHEHPPCHSTAAGGVYHTAQRMAQLLVYATCMRHTELASHCCRWLTEGGGGQVRGCCPGVREDGLLLLLL
jgi:hypothetical protein